MEYTKPDIKKLRIIVIGALSFLGEINIIKDKIIRAISLPSTGYVGPMEMTTWICSDAIGELNTHEIGSSPQLLVTELSKSQLITFNNLLARYELLATNIEAHLCNKRFIEGPDSPFAPNDPRLAQKTCPSEYRPF